MFTLLLNHRRQFLVAIAVVLALPSLAQENVKVNDSYEYHIKKTSEVILIDGKGDESPWKEADVATSFYMVLPMDTSKAKVPTEVRMTYDDKNIYMYVICYHS